MKAEPFERTGGSYERDSDTGELRLVEQPTKSAVIPQPEPEAESPADPAPALPPAPKKRG